MRTGSETSWGLPSVNATSSRLPLLGYRSWCGRASGRRARRRGRAPARATVAADGNPRPEEHVAADRAVAHRFHAREYLAQAALRALSAVAAQVGVESLSAQTGGAGEIESAWNVEALRDHDRALDAEHLARAYHACPRVEPCMVGEDRAGRDPGRQQRVPHRARL